MYLLLVDRNYKYYSQAKVAPHMLGVSVIVPEAKGNHGRRNTRISTPRQFEPGGFSHTHQSLKQDESDRDQRGRRF